MVRRSNEISREICWEQDADVEVVNTAVRDTAIRKAQALRRGITHRKGAKRVIPATTDDAAQQKSELS